MGKLLVQDWNVLDVYSDTLVLRWLSPRQIAALVALAEFLAWRTRYSNPPGQDVLDSFEGETRYNLMTDIEFCALMIGCITTDTDVQDALLDWFLNALDEDERLQNAITNVTYHNTNTFPPNPATTGNILERADCDKDTAAGFVKTGVVDLSCELIYDMFASMEAASNAAETAAAFLDAIPAVGELLDFILVQDIYTYKGAISDWIKETFEAEDTIARREQTYRDLLCLYMQDCSLSIDQIRDYFFMKATEVNADFDNALGTAIDLYNFLINGTVTSFSGIWYIMHAVQFGGAYFIDSLFGMALSRFKLQAARGDPTNDWVVWESDYGACTCFVSWRNPENPIPDLTMEPTRGLTGIAGVLAVSTSDTGTAWTTTTDMGENLPVNDMVELWFVTDLDMGGGGSGGSITGDTFYSDTASSGFPLPFFISPGKWGIKFTFPAPVTGFIEVIDVRKAIGNVENYKWLELRIFSPC